MHIGSFFFEREALGESCISLPVEIGCLGAILDLDVVNVVEAVDVEEFTELLVSSGLHLLELLLRPHVESKGTDHTDMDSEATVNA